uniref:Uncharacterized protein n=1 Tax=Salix viminalis TaxID=40686 RepID=A0A6N2K1D9_SALVM
MGPTTSFFSISVVFPSNHLYITPSLHKNGALKSSKLFLLSPFEIAGRKAQYLLLHKFFSSSLILSLCFKG